MPEAIDQVECPACQGQGVIKKWHGDRSPDRDCEYCKGETYVTERAFHAYFEMRKP